MSHQRGSKNRSLDHISSQEKTPEIEKWKKLPIPPEQQNKKILIYALVSNYHYKETVHDISALTAHPG